MLSNMKVLVAALLSVTLYVSLSYAAPYFEYEYDFYQPDGSKVTLILNGDEFYMRAETIDGYTVVRDSKTGWICYGQLSADGNTIISTGVPVGQETGTKGKYDTNSKSITPEITVDKQLKINIDAQMDIVNERKALLLGDDKDYVGQETAISTKGYSTEDIESAPSSPDVLPATKTISNFSGTIKGIVLIFDFSDAPANYTLSQYEEKVNKPNYYYSNGNARSLRTYYEDVSRGAFILEHYVYGIYRAPKTFAEYDDEGYGNGAHELLSLGLNHINDQGFDFSQLSTNSDGTIKAIALMYTGNPKEWAKGMWYHAGGYGGFSADGVRSGSYCTDKAGDLSPGTLIHEHGHMVAKWPDTYSYIGGEPGTWGVMGGGYCDLPNPYFLYENGWLDGENINGTPSNYTMNSADPYFAYFFYDPDQPTEFYMMKPYTKDLLYCPSIPEEGMSIWRINTNGDNANYPDRDRHIELVHPNNSDNSKSNGVLFKSGGLLDQFTTATVPSSDWKFSTMSGQPSGMEVTNISGPGSQMTFTLGAPPTPVPYYKLDGDVADSSGNNLVPTVYGLDGSAISSDVYTGVRYDLKQCVLFDGIDDYLVCPSGVVTGSNLTISFWVKPGAVDNMVLLDRFPADDNGEGWSVCLAENGKAVFRIGSLTNYTDVYTPYPVYEQNRWLNITCVFVEDGTAKIYTDGKLRIVKSAIPQTTNNSTAELRIAGAAAVNTELRFKGYLDDIRFYDQELKPAYFKNVESMSFRKKNGPVAYLKLDDTDGEDAFDSSGNNMTGSLAGELSFDNSSIAGPRGTALEFDGTDDFISLSSDETLGINEGFTVAMWAYPTSVAKWSRFIDFGNGSASDNIIMGRRDTSNDLFFEVYMNGAAPIVTATGAIELNKWQFFAATVDNNGNVKMYKNGVQIKIGTTNPAIDLYRKNLYIGRSNWSSDAYYKGAMDEIKIYNYPLSADEISKVYYSKKHDMPIPANGDTDTSTEVVLEFDPISGATAVDYYFGTEYASVNNADHDSPEYFGRKYSKDFQPPQLDAWRRYYWRVDLIMADGSIVKSDVWQFDTSGFLRREVWTGLSNDNYISSLLASENYPDNPSLTENISTFELPQNFDEAYGSRVLGMLVPQTSGNYRFWIAGDDEVELWISSDSDPANMELRAYVHNASTGYRNFDQYSSQKSGLITLEGGKAYYVMALQKEGVGGDHMTVAWQGPDSPERSIIDQFWLRLAPGNTWPKFEGEQPASIDAAEGVQLDVALPYAVIDDDGDSVSISKLIGPNWLVTGNDGQLKGTPKDAHVGNNTFILEATDSKGGSDTVILNINVVDRYSGTSGLSDLEKFAAQWLSDTPGNNADLDDDNDVDITDFGKLADNWLVSYVDGLLGYWKFDTSSMTTMPDSYNDYDGKMVNITPNNWSAGVSGNALEFHGSEYVEIEGLTGISGGGPRTVTAFVKLPEDLDNANKEANIIVSYGAAENGKKWIMFADDQTGKLAVSIYGIRIKGGADLEDGQWHHVAAVMPIASDNINQIKLYVDGVEVETNSSEIDSVVSTTTTENILIGAMDNNKAEGVQAPVLFYNGTIDEVRIYSRDLSAEEIAELAGSDN